MNIADSLKMAELHECQRRLERHLSELLTTTELPSREMVTLQAAADHIDLQISELLQPDH